jgi:hypothetical protein
MNAIITPDTLALKAVPLTTWHRRIAHVNYQTFQRMIRNNAVDGITLKGRTRRPKKSAKDVHWAKCINYRFCPGQEQ